MKKSWGNEKTQPDYEIRDNVYQSLKESCMILDNNKRIHHNVFSEMNTNYKEKLDKQLRFTKSKQWIDSKMPSIKKSPAQATGKNKSLDLDDSPKKQ